MKERKVICQRPLRRCMSQYRLFIPREHKLKLFKKTASTFIRLLILELKLLN